MTSIQALAAEVGAETLLRRRLRDVASQYDVVWIDTPPTLCILTVAALVAADQALIPVAAHVLALNGLAQLLETIDIVRPVCGPVSAGVGPFCRLTPERSNEMRYVGTRNPRA